MNVAELDSSTVLAVQVGKIEQKLDDQAKALDAIHRSLKEDIAEVKKQTTETNGRVRALEKGEAMVKGGIAALSLPVVIYILTRLFGG